jgi:hypothetical protein
MGSEAYKITLLRPPLIIFQQIGNFREIEQEGHTIEDDLSAIIFTHIASTVPKWWTMKFLRWMQKLHPLLWENEGLSLVTTPISIEPTFAQ